MNRSARLQPVQRLAGDKADEAGRELAEARQKLDAQRQQLQQLMTFRQEYAQQLQDQNGGINAARLRDFNAFISRIDQAIQQQHKAVAEARRAVEAQRQDWLDAYSHSRAVDRVVDRFRDEEQRAADRREQLQLDELARRTYTNPLLGS
ncbi:flagellar FliJ protein [Alkalispirillum mobile]|uniref:Flagellar FliJ protein n=1 Tax=Alkalispirillum mobile TaxID=85925 RepID=A0A498C7F4_9GAMM|nr:flagellar export protein FliJ [Alkalispirillum mobile]RLK51009.1 flagellar FliJ protein [Alkalispirillum mobile]